jgi:cell fate (sporulation/competence/biofilm development) regulator YlbF (YheA/YmcA/DUF963 family)
MISQLADDPAAYAAAARAAEAEALTAAGTFGAALRASPEFTALLAADKALADDPEASAAIEAFSSLQAEYRVEISMGVLGATQRAELERLHAAMLAVSSVATYVALTAAFEAVCRETAAVISAEIGIDFAANCRSGGCCG